MTQGVHTAWHNQGRSQSAPLVVGEHQGLLVLEMDVRFDGLLDEFVGQFMESLSQVVESAGELRGARVTGSVCRVDIDTLLPSSSDPATEDAPTERFDEGGHYAE